MHPILTWGNGTLGSTTQVDFFLRHMASWGFVVVATEDQLTGPGQTILDAANFMVHANSDPASPFFHKLNVNQIGAFGHSQGAGGAGQAFIKSAGLIKTVVPIELPARVWCTLGPNCFEPANLTGGSVFFIDGSADIPISPPTQSQPPAIIGEQSVQAFYDATPNSVRKLRGTLLGPPTTTSRASQTVLMLNSPASTAYMDTWAIRRRGSWISCRATRTRTEHL
jgi:hypothetical protein